VRLLWLLGLIPFVAADYAVAFSIGQIPIAVQELSGDVTCSLNDFQTSLETSDWQRANEILADCDFATMHESDVRSWFDKPRDVIQAAQQQQQDATSPDIIQAAQRQQIIAFHALRQIQQSARHVAASEGFIDWLVGQVTALGANETQDQDLNAALQAIAAETLGLFMTTVIEQAEAIEVSRDTERIYFSVPPGSDVDTAPISSLLVPTSPPDSSVDTAPISVLLELASNAPNSLRVNVAALQALREIGRALQVKLDEARFAEAGIQGSDRTTWHHHRFWADIVRTLENQISVEEQLFTVVQVARVEALSAFLFVSFDNQEQAYKPDELAARLCPTDFITSESESDIQINRGIQLLTCLSAQAEWEGTSGKTVEIDAAVRAAAIAELERLATIPTFRRELAQQLQKLAIELQWEQERQRQQANRDSSQQDEELLNAQQSLLVTLGISAVEAQGRAENLPVPPQPQSQNIIDRENTQPQQEELYFTDDDLASASLLSLLADGLNRANTGDEFSELQQRAEIAFNDIYGQDLNSIMRAINYADGSGNDDIQKNIVAALGTVNYRNLSEATDLTPIAQFLGQSLLCHEDAEVRRDAAFALGQLAPYHPGEFKKALVDAEQAPFRYRLISDPPPESWGRQLVDICQSMVNDDAESPQVDAESLKIIDALMLRLSDREENIVVAAAYALSQYGIALESHRNAREFLASSTTDTEAVGSSEEFFPLPLGEATEAEMVEPENSEDSETAKADDDPVSVLKTCMMALISPARYEDWPDNLTNQSLIALVEKTEEYVETCPYLLPEGNQDEAEIAAAAISAAFVLGQVGISDGEPEASDEERKIVAHLLRSLAGRDLLAQLAAGTSTPSRVTAVTPLQGAYPYRDDSVRDAIVSYALGQIHPREHELIQRLISAILFEQPLEAESAGRILRCTDVIPKGEEDYFACIEDPVTRASVVGAIEIIGLEAIREIEDGRLDSSSAEQDDRFPAERLARVNDYVARLRQLLTQDVSPTLTEEVVTAVIDRMVSIAGLLDDIEPVEALLTDNQSTQGDQSTPDEPNDPPNLEHPNTSEAFATARYVLGASLTSIYSCSGASWGLARLGVYDTATIDQLVHHLYAFPEPLTRLAPIPELPTQQDSIQEALTQQDSIQEALKHPNRFQGNFCVLALPEAEAEQTSEDLPSRLEQLVIFKTGAIAALGAIGLNSADDPPVSRRYSQATVEGQVVTQSLLYTDQDVKNVIACLVDIANLEMLAFHESSSTSCNQIFADQEPAIQERPEYEKDNQEEYEEDTLEECLPRENNDQIREDNDQKKCPDHLYFPDTELSPAERSRAIRVGLNTDAIDEGQRWGLTVDEMIQAQELSIAQSQDISLAIVDRAYAKLHDVPIDFLRESLEDDRIVLTVDDLIRGWRFGLRSVDDFLDGRRRGLLIPEVIQAAKWGLTPQEFFILKVRLQEPAIEAIGQLAIVETGRSREELTALKALSLVEQEGEQHITGRSRANLQGLSAEQIKILKLRNLEAVLLALQASIDPQTPQSPINIRNRYKIEYIIDEYLIDELRVDRNQYRVKDNISDYFENSDEGLGTIKSGEIEALADGLEQEVERLVLSYRRALERIPEDLAEDFSDPSSRQYEIAKRDREAELNKTYTGRLRQRAEELWEYDQAFRDEVLKVLVGLESETIGNLPYETRERLIAALGIGRRPERLAQQCLSAEDDLFTQERLCAGLARLLTAALNSNTYFEVSPETVDTGTAFLQTLATDPEQETEQATRFNSSRFEIERSSSVIRSSGIEYLGQLEVGYASSPELPNILLARLADGDEQFGVIEHAIQTYYASDPATGVNSLIQVLNSDADWETQRAAAQMVARLGQRTYSNLSVSDEIPRLAAIRWQDALRNEALVNALIRIARTSENSDLRADAITALGSIRTNNSIAVELLQDILLYPERFEAERRVTPEMRIAAAYAWAISAKVIRPLQVTCKLACLKLFVETAKKRMSSERLRLLPCHN
jgi:hypothetical protein